MVVWYGVVVWVDVQYSTVQYRQDSQELGLLIITTVHGAYAVYEEKKEKKSSRGLRGAQRAGRLETNHLEPSQNQREVT